MSWLDQSDSDSNNSNSWILLDDEKGNNDEEEEEEEKEEVEEIAPRKTIQEINEDSDGISIISDPEDQNTESIETKEYETTTESCKGKELVSLDTKPVKGGGSVTSALFMIAGLLIALYFQTSCQDDKAPSSTQYLPSTKSNNLFYETSKFKNLKDEDYVTIHAKGGRREEEDYVKKNYKGSDRKPQYEERSKYEKGIKDKYFKKHNKHDSSEEEKYRKYYDSRESRNKYSKDHEDYLMKKQQYLKQKEEKLKQKEFKMYSKNARQYDNKKYKKYDHSGSGEWYQKMYKGRDDIRSNEHKSDWVFDRAQMRSKKRDKAHWYFNWMDEREDVRFRG